MKDTILEILQAVLIAVIPIIAGYLVNLLKKKADEAAVKSGNATASFLIKEIADAISTVVTYVSQTYVDALKNSGQFTLENQKEAFQKAMDMAMEILSQEARDFIRKMYGNLTNYLTARIEAEVRLQKNSVLTGIELIEE